MQFATTILLDNGHRIHEVLELSGHFACCWVKFLIDNSKPFHIRALAIPCNKTANSVVWDSIVAPLKKLFPYFNSGLGMTSDSLCLRATVLCFDVTWTLDIHVE
jgi:hypothetical protein